METLLFRPFSCVTTETFPISFTHFLAGTTLIIAVLLFELRSKRIYLIDLTCYLPPGRLRVPKSLFIEHVEMSNINGREGIDFQVKVLERSGIGSETCMPTSLHEIPLRGSLDDIYSKRN